MEIGIVSLPLELENGGDSYLIKEFQDYTLIAVVDGLGHGELAHHAAALTIETIENSNNIELDLLIMELHKALKNTVGVVLGLVLIDQINHKLICGGVGNITIKHIGSIEKNIRLPQGILGYRDFQLQTKTVPLTKDDILIMHTDGIRDYYQTSHFSLSKPQIIAESIASNFRNPLDDAIVLVLKNLLTTEI